MISRFPSGDTAMDGLIKTLTGQTCTQTNLERLPSSLLHHLWHACPSAGSHSVGLYSLLLAHPCHSSPEGAGRQEARLDGSSQAGPPAGTIYGTLKHPPLLK